MDVTYSQEHWNLSRMRRALWQRHDSNCFQLREEENGGGRGGGMGSAQESTCFGFAWESSEGYLIPGRHLALHDWLRADTGEEMLRLLPIEPCSQASSSLRDLCQQGCSPSLLRKLFPGLRVSKCDPSAIEIQPFAILATPPNKAQNSYSFVKFIFHPLLEIHINGTPHSKYLWVGSVHVPQSPHFAWNGSYNPAKT